MGTSVSYKSLAQALELLLAGGGCLPAVAQEVAEVMAEADLAGHSTHGARQIGFYLDRLSKGEVNGYARPVVSEDGGAIMRIDGAGAFGQVVGSFAARTGANRALETGVCLINISRSGHLGRNGRWPELAANMGIGSIHFGQGIPGQGPVVPFGGREGRLNTNPIAIGLPGLPGEDALILDCATSVVSGSTVKQAAERGVTLADEVLVTQDGLLTNQPEQFVEGSAALAVFGGFKGHAISIFSEILSSIVAAGGKPEYATNSLFSVYFDVKRLIPENEYAAALSAYCDRIKSCPPINDLSPVLMPGERSAAVRQKRREDGIPLEPDLAQQLLDAAHRVNQLEKVFQAIPELRQIEVP